MGVYRSNPAPSWPGDPVSAWHVTVVADDFPHLERHLPIPQMDDLDVRLHKVGEIRWARLVGWFIMVAGIVIAIGATQPNSLALPWYALAAVASPIVFGLAYRWRRGTPRVLWGPTEWIAEQGVLCEAYPIALRLGKHDAPSSRTFLLIDAGASDLHADRIFAAHATWATHLETRTDAYTEFWKRWQDDQPEAYPSDLLFGPEASGGFLVHAHRDYHWFLLVPHPQKRHHENPWHDARKIPVHWTDEDATAIPFDWRSDDS